MNSLGVAYHCILVKDRQLRSGCIAKGVLFHVLKGVFAKNFLLIDATDRSKISYSDQKRFFIALSLYLLSFFANTPFK